MIALDSSAVICLVQGIEPARAKLASLLHLHRSELLTSTLSITECLTTGARLPPSDLRNDFETFFRRSSVRVEPVTQDVAFLAADFRGRFGLRTPDAVHLATAVVHHAEVFTTTDKVFHRCVANTTIEIQIFGRLPDAT